YTVSFEFAGYQPASTTGINVFQDQVSTINQALSKEIKTIARTTARSSAGAFQPGQTQDTISIGTAQIETIGGRAANINEGTLLTSLPGASLDSSGYPVLRGGRENEEGYNFEGISIVDVSTNQFQNSLTVNGINSFQLTPGAGNATVGNAGTGSINYSAKRGSYPAFGSVEVEAQSLPYTHQFLGELGIANRAGTLSNYFSFIGNRQGIQDGLRATRAVDVGQYNGQSSFIENNLVDNLIYKFGKDKSYELQLLYQNQIDHFGYNYGGGIGTLRQELGDPYFQSGISLPSIYSFFGFTNDEIANAVTPLVGQSDNTSLLGRSGIYQPNEVHKVQLSHNFDSSTFLRLAYFGVNAVTIFDGSDPNLFGIPLYQLQGSTRSGYSADLTKQFGSKNLVQIGGKFEFQRPVYSAQIPDYGPFAAGLGAFGIGGGKGFEFPDFLPPTDANCNTALANIGLTSTCGYLAQYFGGVSPRIPTYYQTIQVTRGDYAAYVNDKLQATKNLNIEAGLRLDGNTTHYPLSFDGVATNVPNDARHPLILEPRLAIAFSPTHRDAFRTSFARSVQYPSLSTVDATIDPTAFQKFYSIPSYNNLLGPFDPANPSATAAKICGPKQNALCPNYGEQLFSEYQYGTAGVPYQPIKPETFTSYDFTISHDFGGGVGLRLTPFYTRGYDIVDQVANVIGFNPASKAPILAPPTSTNLGIERTTGVEFQLTREARNGFSGEISATYLNKFSNVPPLARSEDFFPSIPTASLLLGNLYRVGYLSPFQATAAVQYKTKGGLRINPQITYNRGYPINPGKIFPTFVNGKPVNVPLTDVTGPGVSRSAGQFVDPANPGTVFNPNLTATLGTPDTAAAGGVLSNARFNTNLTLEFAPQTSKSVVGVQIFNLFNQLYTRPKLNTTAQPVATGVLGPQSGLLPSYQYPYASQVPYLAPVTAAQFGQSPYTLTGSNTPIQFLFYFQQKL
ncbi:MAG: TonB-dependent receptor, partial [Candidatus Eremiobacteraeota bacterium]|nr:TonB-dependent receptor [Candidatus Eremiobacteraeota bacterium]